MTTIEKYEQDFFKETPEVKGIELLNKWHEELRPASSLANSAMLLEVTLRNTKNAVATGRDVSILDTPSQELLTDMILDMPIGVREPTPSGQQLFEALVAQTGNKEAMMAEDLIQFTRYIQSATSPYSTLGFQERTELSLNLDSYAKGLQYTAQKLVNKVMDQRGRWGHEGGDINDLQPEIYREFVQRDYIQYMIGRLAGVERPGLSRQVALRMLHESEWLFRQEQTTLQQI